MLDAELRVLVRSGDSGGDERDRHGQAGYGGEAGTGETAGGMFHGALLSGYREDHDGARIRPRFSGISPPDDDRAHTTMYLRHTSFNTVFLKDHSCFYQVNLCLNVPGSLLPEYPQPHIR